MHLATSPDCANQAFRYGDRIYGLQFHLEVDGPLIERWLRTPGHIRELESLAPNITADRIRDETPDYIGHSTELGAQVFGEFIRLFSSRARRSVLPSR